MMDLPRPNVFAVAVAFVAVTLPFADGASAQGGGEDLVSWLRSSLERVEVTERPRSTERPRQPAPREESSDRAQRPPVVIDERNRRGDRSRRPRGRDRQDERSEQDERTDRRGREAERGREGRRGGSATPRTKRAEGPPKGRRGAGEPGPPFCRSGAGHPVFGMAWCRERGFAPQVRPNRRYERNRRYGERDRRYEERRRRQERHRGSADIVFEDRRQRQDARLSEARLEDVLGSRVLGRLVRLGRRLEPRSELSGRWVGGRGEQVLRVQAGSQVLAELIDSDRDGRVDRALVAEPASRR